MTSRFCHFALRTTDVDAARGFYTELLGEALWGEAFAVVPLPERARARGARAHWLGHLGVDDVEDATRRLVGHGAEPLGPLVRTADGVTQAALRDPFGAVVGLRAPKSAPPSERVAWHLLHVHDEARAFALYASLSGWEATESADHGAALGDHQMFAWDAAKRSVGSVANTARLPQIHTHWLYFFRVDDLDASLATVRARGGITLDAARLPSGARVAPCDDPQGAAFGLYQEAQP